MVWTHGPGVQSVQTVPLAQLPDAMRPLPSSVRDNVNVSDLLRRFGRRERVAVVIMTGTYNSLPPDEGVDVKGQVVALVDTRDDRVILLTD
jgi:hypothetical protein